MTQPTAVLPAEWLNLVRTARQRHEYLEAIDLVRQGLELYPSEMQLHYEKILAHARIGALESATLNLAVLASSGQLDLITDPGLRADFAGLGARLLKDRALTSEEFDPALVLLAAEAYRSAFTLHSTSYLAVNAATLFALAGDNSESTIFAHAALACAAQERASYYRHAAVAEALLLLGNISEASDALKAALATAPPPDEVATTRRQLLRLTQHCRGGAEILAALPVPYVLCWQVDREQADRTTLPPEFRHLIEQRRENATDLIAYGAIRGLADIVAAEFLIEFGAETNLVIVASPTECERSIAAAAGAEWAERFRRITTAARRIMEITLEGDVAEPTLACMAVQQALGQAAMRSAAAVAPTHHVRWSKDGEVTVSLTAQMEHCLEDPAGRLPRAFVFGDVRGFSQLCEAQHRPFLDYVVGGFADALATLGDQVEYVEIAGDGIFVVLSNAIAGLRCCDRLRRIFVPELLLEAGLPASLGLRVGAHFGPAARGLDRVTGRQKFIGKEVIRAARLEPVTPVGEIYVTEQFAATLFATTPVGHACEYVGEQPMAKGFGRCRMYSLRPTREILRLLDTLEEHE